MRILTCLLFVTAVLASDDQSKTPAQPAATQPKTTVQHKTIVLPKPAAKRPVAVVKKPAAIVEIPKDAVETSPGFYNWTDKDGKVWTYRRTPFGVSRWPAQSMYSKQDVADEQTTAVEQGDSIRFERSSPFGHRTWVRKKTELTESERATWESQQKNSAASRPAEKE